MLVALDCIWIKGLVREKGKRKWNRKVRRSNRSGPLDHLPFPFLFLFPLPNPWSKHSLSVGIKGSFDWVTGMLVVDDIIAFTFFLHWHLSFIWIRTWFRLDVKPLKHSLSIITFDLCKVERLVKQLNFLCEMSPQTKWGLFSYFRKKIKCVKSKIDSESTSC